MNYEQRFIEAVLEDKLPIPGAVLQLILNQYVSLYNIGERYFGINGYFINPDEQEIAVRSRELMDTHYNMPRVMFENFLGKSMKYSAALWRNGTADLDAAQEAMMADLCRKLEIQDGERVLDIGCGFGSFADHVLRNYPNTKVYGLTLSQTQADYMREMQAQSGHALSTDRFYLIQEDFNNVTFEHPFDRVVSIGVFEHISSLSLALEKIRSFIADHGTLMLHYITYRPWPGSSHLPRQDPFIDRNIFPGGRVWAQTELHKHQTHFKIAGEWYLNGNNYRRTLQAWLANFLNNYKKIESESGLPKRKLKLWEFYLRACIAVFRIRGGRIYGNGQYLLRPL